MVDREGRDKAAEAVRRFRDGEITNKQYERAWDGLRSGDDRALRDIHHCLWFSYDDIRTHRMTGEWALPPEGCRLWNACLAFLESNLEYQDPRRGPYPWPQQRLYAYWPFPSLHDYLRAMAPAQETAAVSDLTVRLVTGAFGFTGRHLTERLLARGFTVRTLTGHPERANPFGDRVEVRGFSWDDPAGLVESLRGAEVLYNTYWIRFGRGELTFARAAENSLLLWEAAREAGVRRVVHISIANPSLDSPLPYYSGKARVEQALVASGLEYAIIRPTVIFGDEGILINNLAWMLRRLPVFATPGDGEYRMQPVYVGDLAEMMVEAGEGESCESRVASRELGKGAAGEGLTPLAPLPQREGGVRDAVGPEVYTFNELLALLKEAVGSRALVLHLPAWMVLVATKVMGWGLGDVILTRDEVAGLRQNLLVSHGEATCPTRLSDWVEENRGGLGRKYMSEVRRHYR